MSLNLHSSERLYQVAPGPTRTDDLRVVLVVLDRVDARRQLGQVLTSKAYSVVDTDNGQEAARQARQTKPDLVLVDLDVPLLYGLVAARQIVKHGELGAMPVVIVTHEETIDPAPMIEVGITRHEYVTRLSDYTELHRLLEYLLPVLPPSQEDGTGDSSYPTRAEPTRLQLLPVNGPARHPHRDAARGKPATNQTHFALRTSNHRL